MTFVISLTPSPYPRSKTELEDWLETEDSRSVGDNEGEESTGHASGRRIVTIKRTNKADISDDQWDPMAKVLGYIKRHLPQAGPDEGKETSNWRYSLMNWGQPLGAVLYSE